MIDLYGIPNCDTVKKARLWLDERELTYTFHDFKKEGVDAGALTEWLAILGRDLVVNKRGTTYRALSDDDKAAIENGDAARILIANPSVIKRPILKHSGGLLIGFKEADWAVVGASTT